MIRMTDMVNCTTTSTFLKPESLKLSTLLPLKTFRGWNEESKKAGYRPFNRNDISKVAPIISMITGEENGWSNCRSVNVLNHGRLT
jgi:hypothetical protein